MKTLKIILIVVLVVAIAVFTGTWIFQILSTVFHGLGNGLDFLARIFNLFGWNNGMLR
ncbi:MAG: hypothetical protein ACI4L6_00515 [Candidatus Onthoplasma sp.]